MSRFRSSRSRVDDGYGSPSSHRSGQGEFYISEGSRTERSRSPMRNVYPYSSRGGEAEFPASEVPRDRHSRSQRRDRHCRNSGEDKFSTSERSREGRSMSEPLSRHYRDREVPESPRSEMPENRRSGSRRLDRDRGHRGQEESSRSEIPWDRRSRSQRRDRGEAGPSNRSSWSRLVGSRFEISSRIGEGYFGKVYKAIDTTTGTQYAAKVADSPVGIAMLRNEDQLYSDLSRMHVHSGLAKRHYFGSWNSKDVLVLDLLGEPLNNRLINDRTYEIRNVLRLGIQMNRVLQTIHDSGWLHRDIKPSNMLRGGDGEKDFYLVDFGVAKRYEAARRDRAGSSRYRDLNIPGDILFASPNCHENVESSFRDDFFSLGYSMVQMYRGRLPWEKNYSSHFNKTASRMKRVKQKTSFHSLTSGMSREVETFFGYISSLSFSSRVDHSYVEELFTTALKRRYGTTM